MKLLVCAVYSIRHNHKKVARIGAVTATYTQVMSVQPTNYCTLISSDVLNGMARKRLDRRRLEVAHFKYAVLCVAPWYPCDIKYLPK